MTNISWNIASLERTQDAEKVTGVHYIVNAIDDYYSASVNGEVTLQGDVTIPYDSLQEADVVSWVKAVLGAEKVEEIEQNLTNSLRAKAAKTRLSGVPWGESAPVESAALEGGAN